MRVPGGTAIDVRALLAQVEAGPPVEAAESVAATLAEVLDARSATFLVSDFSGHAVVRLTSVGAVTGATGADPFASGRDRTSLQLPVSDAVGHEVSAALLATLRVGALRNARRRGLPLTEQARSANQALAAHAPVGQFVTGQLLRVDLAIGRAAVVNAGHPSPLRLRDGRVTEVPLEVQPPFGVDPGRAFVAQEFPLEPGDRIVFLTDGMQERNAASLDVAHTLARTADLHPREVVHELGAAVMRATHGDLRDDATMICLDWYGGPLRPRHADDGSGRR